MNERDLFGFSFNNVPLFDEMYERFLSDPKSVDPSWQKLFRELDSVISQPNSTKEVIVQTIPQFDKEIPKDIRIYRLINAYRRYGHLYANVNPIAVTKIPLPSQLSLQEFGFQESDLSENFPTCGLLDPPEATLGQILLVLQRIYCGSFSIEYMDLDLPDMEKWIQSKIEPIESEPNLSIEQKQMILQYLNKSELFEMFLHTKYVGQKRFSLEGAETLIPILAFIIEIGASLGADEFVMGMAHRGRLNVLSNILEKSYTDIFSEFEENYLPDSFEGSGDVKYHKGFHSEISTSAGHRVQIFLAANPSHLESVDPVVEGEAKAKQLSLGENRVLPLLIHGDGAISGQGVVYETMQLCNLEGYKTNGTMHIVINNQIGFTTLPEEGRSTRYCTDIAKSFGCPVIHVNTEDPEACIFATILATELRHKFQKDVFLDLVCYRKYGHNESDEPAFTQPLEYQVIRQKKTVREIYRDHLIQEGIVEKYMAEKLEIEFKKALNDALRGSKLRIEDLAKKGTPSLAPKQLKELFSPVSTRVSRDEMQKIAEQCCTVPDSLILHKKLYHLLEERMEMAKGNKPFDWGMAEMMAYATLLWQGVDIRLSGQDSGRGTFSHRHLQWISQKTDEKYFPLSHLKRGQGRCDILNSPLSEFASVGFEFGYSMARPDALVLWEAQFGDFCNGAQIVIDQFISTSEQKWGTPSNLVLLLPHGYEGQGPEHSSARMERFLLLAGDENMLICNPTTPAQFFHLLRRQVLKKFYKPSIVFTPKGLLRHSLCISSLDDFTKDSFQEILDDPAPPKNPARIAFCSGRIFYDLFIEREKMQGKNVILIRMEQLYPLHMEEIKKMISKYKGIKEYIWVQEEPKNMGAWSYIQMQLESLLPTGMKLKYIGRDTSASPATGYHALHRREHAAILKQIFPIEEEPNLDIRHFQSV